MRILCMVVTLFIVSAHPLHARMNLVFCYDPYPPETIGKDGEYTTRGLKVRLLKAIVNEIDGVEARVMLYPWKRCQEQAKIGALDGIMPLAKNTEREQYLVFTESCWEQASEPFSARALLLIRRPPPFPTAYRRLLHFINPVHSIPRKRDTSPFQRRIEPRSSYGIFPGAMAPNHYAGNAPARQPLRIQARQTLQGKPTR